MSVSLQVWRVSFIQPPDCSCWCHCFVFHNKMWHFGCRVWPRCVSLFKHPSVLFLMAVWRYGSKLKAITPKRYFLHGLSYAYIVKPCCTSCYQAFCSEVCPRNEAFHSGTVGLRTLQRVIYPNITTEARIVQVATSLGLGFRWASQELHVDSMDFLSFLGNCAIKPANFIYRPLSEKKNVGFGRVESN